LHFVTGFAGQKCELLAGFDAFRDDRQIEPVARPMMALMIVADWGLRSRFAMKLRSILILSKETTEGTTGRVTRAESSMAMRTPSASGDGESTARATNHRSARPR